MGEQCGKYQGGQGTYDNLKTQVRLRPREVWGEKSLTRRSGGGKVEKKYRAWPAIVRDILTRISVSTHGWLWELRELTCIKHLKQCSAHKCQWPSAATIIAVALLLAVLLLRLLLFLLFDVEKWKQSMRLESDLGSSSGTPQMLQTIKYFWPSRCDPSFILGTFIWDSLRWSGKKRG